jgi:Rieske Fe-S protein
MRRRGIPEEGMTRRSFLKGALAAGTAGFLGVAGFTTVQSLISPEVKVKGQVLDTFIYINPEGARLPIWFEDLIGEEAKITHFKPGRGANVLWKAVIDEEGQIVPFTGFPGLLIQLNEEELEFPQGYSMDEFVVEGLYAIFNCCTHACCRPGWQLIPRSAYKVDPGYDTVYCVCHDSQYNPRRIFKYRHPPPPDASGAEYIGIYKEPGLGPADRGMPLIPIELDGNKIVGISRDQNWYRYLDFKSRIIPE